MSVYLDFINFISTIHIISLIVLIFNAVVLFFWGLKFLFSKIEDERVDEIASGRVAVIMAIHGEGEGCVDAIQTALSQKLDGDVDVYALMFNESDPTYALLESKIQNTHLKLVKVGEASKMAKLNYILNKLEGYDFIAILDADHRVESNWLNDSIIKIRNKSVDYVQAARRPLGTLGFSSLWDSSQNHLGNELYNIVLKSFGLNNFFTGTACVFKSKLLEKRVMPDCITEDTYLSYDLFLNQNIQSSHIDSAKSYEEVSPNIKTYLARRRRWSGGHNKTFFKFVFPLLKSKIPFFSKIAYFFHAQFFFASNFIITLLLSYGLYQFVQYSNEGKYFVLGVSALLSSVTAVLMFRSFKFFIFDLIFGFIWPFALACIWGSYFYKWTSNELYYYITTFPLAKKLNILYITLLCIPFLIIILSNLKLKIISWWKFFLLALSYPVYLFLDIQAFWLGLIDTIFKTSHWIKVSRSSKIETSNMPIELSQKLAHADKIKASKFIPILVTLISIFLVIINDLAVDLNCGDPHYIFGRPLLFEREDDTDWKISISKKIKGNNELQIKFKSVVNTKEEAELVVWDGPKRRLAKSFTQEINYTDDYKIAWKQKKLNFHLKQGNKLCKKEVYFSTIKKEIKNKQVFINGESFILKGIIPSFSSSTINKPISEGLAQIKSLGANAIRMYHAPTDKYLEELEKNNLLVIDQPDESTWDNMDLASKGDKKSLSKRFEKLTRDTQGFPFALIHNLGNELELSKENNRDINIENLKSLLADIPDLTSNAFKGYATYLTYIPYPAQILGINMLDVGSVYWKDAFDNLDKYNIPYYASEFGGFVAYYEKTYPIIRAYRIFKQWKNLMKRKTMGAVFFQSHDNWAQQVNDGVNDPLIAEQPDDTRGVFDHNDRPKLISFYLKQLYSDISIKVTKDKNQFVLSIKNKRPYQLEKLRIENFPEISKIEPYAEVKQRVDQIIDGKLFWDAYFETHRGLKQVAKVRVVLPYENSPMVYNDGFYPIKHSKEEIEGLLLNSNTIHFSVPPDWKSFSLLGEVYKNTKKQYAIAHQGPYKEAQAVQVFTNKGFVPLEQDYLSDKQVLVRFKAPKGIAHKREISLEGVGGDEVEFWVDGEEDQKKKYFCHAYRDCHIPLMDFKEEGKFYYIDIDRVSVNYISRDSYDGKPIQIKFRKPRFYSPDKIIIKRID